MAENMNATNDLNLKCLSLNVRGLNKTFKRRLVFRWLHKQKQQFIFLQECYIVQIYAHLSGEMNGEVMCFSVMAQTTVKA